MMVLRLGFLSAWVNKQPILTTAKTALVHIWPPPLLFLKFDGPAPPADAYL